jgi:tRNA 2-thiouridine synthesizing protein A
VTRIVDALGTRCPIPVILASRAAAASSDGELIQVLADDPLVRVDLRAWCHEDGHTLLELDEVSGEFRALVRVGADPSPRG